MAAVFNILALLSLCASLSVHAACRSVSEVGRVCCMAGMISGSPCGTADVPGFCKKIATGELLCLAPTCGEELHQCCPGGTCTATPGSPMFCNRLNPLLPGPGICERCGTPGFLPCKGVPCEGDRPYILRTTGKCADCPDPPRAIYVPVPDATCTMCGQPGQIPCIIDGVQKCFHTFEAPYLVDGRCTDCVMDGTNNYLVGPGGLNDTYCTPCGGPGQDECVYHETCMKPRPYRVGPKRLCRSCPDATKALYVGGFNATCTPCGDSGLIPCVVFDEVRCAKELENPYLQADGTCASCVLDGATSYNLDEGGLPNYSCEPCGKLGQGACFFNGTITCESTLVRPYLYGNRLICSECPAGEDYDPSTATYAAICTICGEIGQPPCRMQGPKACNMTRPFLIDGLCASCARSNAWVKTGNVSLNTCTQCYTDEGDPGTWTTTLAGAFGTSIDALAGPRVGQLISVPGNGTLSRISIQVGSPSTLKFTGNLYEWDTYYSTLAGAALYTSPVTSTADGTCIEAIEFPIPRVAVTRNSTYVFFLDAVGGTGAADLVVNANSTGTVFSSDNLPSTVWNTDLATDASAVYSYDACISQPTFS